MKTVLALALVALCTVASASDDYRDPRYGYDDDDYVQHEAAPKYVARKYVAPKYVAPEYVAPKYTSAPEYFTTTRYGPVKHGREEGRGQRSSALSFTKNGKAHGTLYAHDEAEASETASKTRGYQYQYK